MKRQASYLIRSAFLGAMVALGCGSPLSPQYSKTLEMFNGGGNSRCTPHSKVGKARLPSTKGKTGFRKIQRAAVKRRNQLKAKRANR